MGFKRRFARRVADPFAERIAQLRKSLVDATEFAPVNRYFHDELADDPGFRDAGSFVEHPKLLACVRSALEFAAPGGELSHPLIQRVTGHPLYHGCATWGDGATVFFYFEDIDKGLCAFTRLPHHTDLVRFSVRHLSPGGSA